MPTDHAADEKWSAYADTLLRFDGPAPLRVDLRRPLDERTRDALRGLGLGQPFAVLTAENPEGENPEDAPSESAAEQREARNDRRAAGLARALEETGIFFVPVVGSAPDGSYGERCVAAVMPRRDAVALAKKLDQLALFWYDGSDFWLLPAEVDAPPERLPRGPVPE